ncbi:MAG: 4-hydroxy-tetrahydrodipicolinate reductase [Cyclobacteriaceae bacterium]
MNIALLGYGKMGREIAALAEQRGHHISAKIDEHNKDQIEAILSETDTDVAIEFSQPEAALENIKCCLQLGIPVISGTTGWLDRRAEIEAYCQSRKGTFFYASNYSLGVQLFFKLNRYLSKLMGNYSEYDIQMTEIHHTEKKDAPSGTAITLAEDIISNLSHKKSWEHPPTDDDAKLGIESFRKPDVPGTHQVIYRSEVDDLEIKHTAHSRKGFALGAVMVAEWIKDKKGILSMDDFLNI